MHFRNLAHKNVLNPKWVTEAVYKIINSKKTAQNHGIINQDDIDYILNKEKFTDMQMDLTLKKVTYALDERNYIVDLMKEFELCYSLSKEQILIPDLLNVEEPDFDFYTKNCIRFQFEYDFLSRSVMPRFIVKTHKDTDGKQLWRTGIVLRNKIFKARALVIADDHARKINLYVNGEQKRHYFATILYAFREINHSFEKLSAVERVPMPDDAETTVSYNHLLVLSSLGKDDFVPDGSTKEYSVAELLGEIQLIKPTESEALEILKEIRDKLKADDENAFLKALEIKPGIFGVSVDVKALSKKLYTKIKTK